jgi:hypothetical protein
MMKRIKIRPYDPDKLYTKDDFLKAGVCRSGVDHFMKEMGINHITAISADELLDKVNKIECDADRYLAIEYIVKEVVGMSGDILNACYGSASIIGDGDGCCTGYLNGNGEGNLNYDILCDTGYGECWQHDDDGNSASYGIGYGQGIGNPEIHAAFETIRYGYGHGYGFYGGVSNLTPKTSPPF